MNALALWYPSDSVIIWGVNVLLQVSAVTAIALAIAAFLRRSSAVRYWVLCSSLLLVLFSPLTTLLLQVSGKSFLAVSLTQAPGAFQSEPYVSAEVPPADVPSVSLLRNDFGSPPDLSQAFTDGLDRSERLGAVPPADMVVPNPLPPPEITPPRDQEAAAVPTSPPSLTRIGKVLRLVMPPLLMVWFLGAVLLLARLVLGWCRLATILHSAKPHANALFKESYERVGQVLKLTRMPELVLSRHVATPIAAGLFKPRVVLPEQMVDRVAPEQLRDVLVHEVAHIVRRDQIVVLLQNLAAAVLWLHPLVKILNRQLARAREEVCDNYVLAATDAPSYSRTLLTLAESIQKGSPLPGAVGLFTSRWKLERRVADLLDERRCRTVRPTMRGKTCVIALSLIMTMVAAVGTVTLAVGQADKPDATADASPRENGEAEDANDFIEVTGVVVKNADPEPASQTDTTVVRGTAADAEGKPAEGAFIAVVALNMHPKGSATRSSPRGEVLGEATTDDIGEFEIRLDDVTSKTHVRGHLIARTSDSGLVWQKLDLGAGETQTTLTLPPQQLIEARLVDLEGQAAAGLTLDVASVAVADPGNRPSKEIGFGIRGLEQPPRAWPEPLTTDDQGRVTIRNVPPGHGVYLKVPGTEKFAPQQLALNTGMPEERAENDATYRSLVKNVQSGEVATVALAPAQFFEGVVLLGDSDKPAANARITIWASQQQGPLGSMVAIEGKTDEAGRFRLNPWPGVRFGIIAYPPEGAPYQIRRLEDLRWNSGAGPKEIEIRLDEGVLARGTIVDAETGEPLHEASVQYHPDRVHNANLSSDVVTGWQSIQKTDEDGQFAITVLPGPGTLLVHAAHGSYILQEVGSRELSSGEPGGVRSYAHAFQKIDPQADEPLEAMEIGLQPGASVAGILTDPQGNPIKRALIVSRLKILDSSPQWRGFTDEALNGRFQINGLREGEEYPVHFLDPENRLGATAMISTKNPSPTVVLEPCGSATARFVDPDGDPVVDARFGLHMVVTPGKPQYDRQAMERGELLADEDAIANIDRDNHRSAPATDENGERTFPALIPGARYRFINFRDGNPRVAKEFVARSGETYEMGEIEVDIAE